ncbi:MAG TPA: hypothetical protein VIG24_18395 [Acidimicrobiia bacterium]
MALGDAYASVAELETRLGTSDDGTYEALLDAASRAVESFTRRQFNKTETASARRFRAVDPRRLPVDDFHTTTDLAVEVDDTAWTVADDVDPRPWNGIVDGQEGWPFFDLFAVRRYWPFSRRAPVTVTAQWGWAAVPEGIRQTTLNVAASVVSSASTSATSGQVKSMAIDGYSVSFVAADGTPRTTVVDLTTFSLADPYRRKRFGVA